MHDLPKNKLVFAAALPLTVAATAVTPALADDDYDSDPDIAEAVVSPDDHEVPERAGNFAAARARSANAEERLNRARLVYRAATHEARDEYREQPGFESSYQAFNTAWNDYRDARAEALKPLRDNDRYRTLIERAEQIDQAIAEAEDDGKPGDPALAQERLEIAEQLAAMRDDAVRDSTTVADANQAFKNARRELDQLIDQQDDAVESGSAVSQAKEQWRYARRQLNTAEVERAEALAEYRAAVALEREDERDDDRLIDAVDNSYGDDVDVD